MDPTITCCPNLACPARGQTGQGNMGIHACKDKRFLCTECHKTCSATHGTACSRLRTSAETVSLVITLMAHGCPLHAMVVACGSDERTVARWLARAGGQGQAVQKSLVEHPRDLGQVQADAIRVTTQGRSMGMALAMMVHTRLWRAGEVRAQRDMALMHQRIARVRRWAAHRALVCCTDGLCSSIRAMRETFCDPQSPGAPGRPRLRPWRNLCIAQVVKRSVQRRVVDIVRRIVDGTPARVETLRRRSQGDGVLNTARSGAGTAPADRAARHVYDRDGLSLLHTACESRPGRSWDTTRNGRWHHGSLLVGPGIAVGACATAALDATHAARASLTCAQAPY